MISLKYNLFDKILFGGYQMKNRYENKDEIYKCLQEKRYGDLLHIYYINSNMSITEMSKRIKCSRRALKRYLSGERLVPMKIIRYILEEYEIEYKSSDNADQGEFNENGAFIWYKEVKLFNTLYLVRSKILSIERFEAACMLDIPEDILKGYENGTKNGKRELPQGVKAQKLQTESDSKTRQIRQMPILPNKNGKTRQIRLYL